MQWFFNKIWMPLYGRWALNYIRRSREYAYAGIRVEAPPGVFHPGVFLSTPIFIDYLQTLDFQGKKVADVGSGSGMLAIFAALKGAEVTAVDINPAAVETTRRNASRNGAVLRALESDLFMAIPPDAFDIILVNPPYFAAAPRDMAQRAFFAGEQLEYFDQFFGALPHFIHPGSKVLMILSTDCDLQGITEAARRKGFGCETIWSRRKWGKELVVISIDSIVPIVVD